MKKHNIQNFYKVNPFTNEKTLSHTYYTKYFLFLDPEYRVGEVRFTEQGDFSEAKVLDMDTKELKAAMVPFYEDSYIFIKQTETYELRPVFKGMEHKIKCRNFTEEEFWELNKDVVEETSMHSFLYVKNFG